MEQYRENTGSSEPVEPEIVSADETPQEKKKVWAFIAYFIFFLPLLTDQKNNPYVKFHVKQGLLLFISFVIQTIIIAVPVIGWIAGTILWFINILLLIIGILNALTGKQKELPLIGHLAEHLKF